MPRRVFVDTEWTAAPWLGAAELMWIGLADEAGRSWYGISSEVEIDPTTNPFVSGAFRLIDRDEPPPPLECRSHPEPRTIFTPGFTSSGIEGSSV